MSDNLTAADFAAARFAQHPDGRIAARVGWTPGHPWTSSGRCRYSDSEMAAQGWRIVTPAPDPSDPEVIEQAAQRAHEARYAADWPDGRASWDTLNPGTRDAWRAVVRAVLTPPPARDPKVDELKEAIEVHWDGDDPGEIARYLIAQGWERLGGGKDE